MNVFYNGTLVSNNFGVSPYYLGNSFLNLKFTVGIPPLPVITDIHPWGFVGNAPEGTTYLCNNGLAFFAIDSRPIPDVAMFKAARGSSMAYSTLQDENGNVTKQGYAFLFGALAKILTRYTSGGTDHQGFGIEANSDNEADQFIKALLPNGEPDNFFVLYTYLLNILNSLFSYIGELKTYIASHEHPNGDGGHPTGAPTSPPPNDTYYDSGQYTTDSNKMKTQR